MQEKTGGKKIFRLIRAVKKNGSGFESQQKGEEEGKRKGKVEWGGRNRSFY